MISPWGIMQVFASNFKILAVGSPKVKNCYLNLYESLGDKLTLSSAEEAARLAHNNCISGMDLGRGDCQLLTDTQLSLKPPNLHFNFCRTFEFLGLLNN